MKRFLIVILMALGLSTTALAQDRDYKVGQVWAYKTASGDEGSLIKIQEVDQIGPEEDPMVVYHISMVGIRVGSGSEAMVIPLPHAPVSKTTLDSSVSRQVDTEIVFPDYRDGKDVWSQNEGGVFTVSLAEIADIIRQTIAGRF